MKLITTNLNGEIEERDLSEEEVAELQASFPQEERDALQLAQAKYLEEQKRRAYAAEADPLFFKAQRGEATMEEWQAKVAEIKERYPDLA